VHQDIGGTWRRHFVEHAASGVFGLAAPSHRHDFERRARYLGSSGMDLW